MLFNVALSNNTMFHHESYLGWRHCVLPKISEILEKVTRFTGFWMGSPSLFKVCSSPIHFTPEEFYSFSAWWLALISLCWLLVETFAWIFPILRSGPLCPYFDSAPLKIPNWTLFHSLSHLMWPFFGIPYRDVPWLSRSVEIAALQISSF